MLETNPLVYISYRREDTGAVASLLHRELRDAFPGQVFMDDARIDLGAVWPDRLRQALDSATMVLVLIGDSWLKTHDEAGRRKLDRDDDWVRQEISYSLERNLYTVPVLIGGAFMPTTDWLPDNIRELTFRQAVKLWTESWDADLDVLKSLLSEHGFRHEAPKEPPTSESRQPRVFMTYSRIDEELFQEFRVHLAHWEEDGLLRIWRDEDIEPGVKWHSRIQRELNVCTVALLLVSPFSLASSYVRRHELPHILNRHKKGEIQLACLYLRPTMRSARQIKVPTLDETIEMVRIDTYQGLNDPGRPVNTFEGAERELELVKAAEKLEKLTGLFALPAEDEL